MEFRIFGIHIFILSRKEVDKMAAIYVALIINGLYDYEKVPTFNGTKDKVKEMLVALGYDEVVGE